MAGGEHGGAQRLTSAELRARILELRRDGLGFRDIAERVGRSHVTVWHHYQAACREIPAAAVEALRTDQLARIQLERDACLEILHASHPVVSNGHVVSEIVGQDETGKPVYGEPLEDAAPRLAAIRELRSLDDQEMKVTGGYPATKVELGGAVRYEVVGVPVEDIA
jgi:hypothetical protein